jgi:hypothetical protein
VLEDGGLVELFVGERESRRDRLRKVHEDAVLSLSELHLDVRHLGSNLKVTELVSTVDNDKGKEGRRSAPEYPEP